MERREKNLEETKAYLRRIREKNKKYFDKRHNIRHKPLEAGILILVYNTISAMNISSLKKLSFR